MMLAQTMRLLPTPWQNREFLFVWSSSCVAAGNFPGVCKMKKVHLDLDAVPSDCLRGKVVVVYGPSWDSVSPSWANGPGYYALKNLANAEPITVPQSVVERPADKLSRPPAVGSIRTEPHRT
jgi:hypothetical protein